MKAILMCDKITMKVIKRFDSAGEAAKRTGEIRESIGRSCLKKHVSSGAVVWRYEEDYDPEETFDGKHNRPVEVVDTKDGAKTVYCNIGDAAYALVYCERAVNHAIRKGKLVGGRYKLGYAR